jgi:hypothetical protein
VRLSMGVDDCDDWCIHLGADFQCERARKPYIAEGTYN